MDIYQAETRESGLSVYRDRSRSVRGEAPIVGCLGPPEAIRDLLDESADPAIVLDWEIYCPNNKDMKIPPGVPIALCQEIAPEDMAGASPFVAWVPITYEELLQVIAGR